MPKPKKKGEFVRDRDSFYNIRPDLQKLHQRADRKLAEIEKKYSKKFCKLKKIHQ
jgi:23S rRNA U2552 (ribose-2'-O)-methylase RlmE/FtsJ